MPNSDATRVVGVCAYSGPGRVFLYEDACMVAGSAQQIRTYLAMLAGDAERGMHISKLRFGEIHDGLNTGAAYAFDRQAYARFYSLARRAGMDDLEGFPQSPSEDLQLIKVKLERDK